MSKTILFFIVIFSLFSPHIGSVEKKEKIHRYYNARILRDHELQLGEIWCANGKIIKPRGKADLETDVQGFILAPGYIDLQINGGFGIDFSLEPNQVEYVANKLPQYGVTAFLPTIVSVNKEQYSNLLPYLQARPVRQGATILGIHLEGPFFNPKQCGAHNPLFISSFKGPIEECYISLEGVKIITLAPEMPGALDVIRFLKAKNIVIAAGHTLATYEEMQEAALAGVSLVTHLFNAMSSFHHRAPGVIGAVLTDATLFYSVIADGIHLHPAALALAWKCHPHGLVLVTDAMEALGSPSGIYHLGSMTVEVENEKAYILGTKTIAGSILSMDKAVRFFHSNTNCSLVEALESASLRPAQVLGIQEIKGTLSEGADADFIFLDESLYVQACYISGELAWQNSR